ncbi:GL24209 [Drosophila persimilis]|uniref:GL24209 n=2 Tax=Drosophila persimilis TaxID=7234 RepID=B4GUR8_DROPE|nr:GL24209 [Drosophila persimilis]
MERVVCLLFCIAVAAAMDLPNPDEATPTVDWTDEPTFTLGLQDETELDLEDEPTPTLNLEDFYGYNSMMEYLRNLSQTYCCTVTRQSLTTTYENRSVELVKISDGQGTSEKKVILLDAGTHGNEWITTTVALKIVHELVVNQDAHARLLESCDWYVLPMVNPDGYTYSLEQKLKLWQKNRSPHGGQYGTNLNRNYDTHWNLTEDAPTHSQYYPGSSAFSELETLAVGGLMRDLVETKREFLYITLHTENKSIFYPSVFDTKTGKTDGLLHAIAQLASGAIFEKTRSVYVPSLAYGYDGVGGTSLDYAYEVGIPLLFAFEMPEMRAEAESKTTFITHQAMEGWEGVRHLALGALEMYSPSKSSSNTTSPPSDGSKHANSTCAPATNDAPSVDGSFGLPAATFSALLAYLALAVM